MSPNDPRLPAVLALVLALPLAAAPAPKAAAKVDRIAYLARVKDGFELRAISPDGKDAGTLIEFAKGDWPDAVRLSRDGSRAALVVVPKADDPAEAKGEVRVYDLARPERPPATLATGIPRGAWQDSTTLAWGADDDTLFVSRTAAPPEGRKGTAGRAWEVTRYDVRTGKGARVALPSAHTVVDVSPDGKTLLVESETPRTEVGGGFHHGTHLADAATLKLTEVARLVSPYRFSPDGKKILGLRMTERVSGDDRLTVLDPKAGTEKGVDLGGKPFGGRPKAAWSADGRRLLVRRVVRATGEEEKRQREAGAFVPTVLELFTCDPDGSARKPMPAKGPDGKYRGWLGFDWR